MGLSRCLKEPLQELVSGTRPPWFPGAECGERKDEGRRKSRQQVIVLFIGRNWVEVCMDQGQRVKKEDE